MSNRPVSVSGVSLYNTCAAKYKYRYLDNIVVRESDSPARDKGSLIHEGIGAALKYGDEGSNIEIATAAMMEYAYSNTIDLTLVDECRELLEYYMPMIGINSTIRAYLKDGVPLIEYGIETEIDGVTVRGYVDAVVQHKDGRVLLLDWKVRRTLVDTSAVMLDKQLPVYFYILKNIVGVPLDGAMQVQICSALPSVPSLKKDGCVSKSLGKTTSRVIDAFVSTLSRDQKQSSIDFLLEKIVPDTEFLRYSKIDVGLVDTMFALFLNKSKEIRDTDVFTPVLDTYICESCQYKDHCYARIKGVK